MIYLDHSAATPIRDEALKAMLPYFQDKFANPSSLYSLARENARDLANARAVFGSILNADSPDEIIFTSGGTESCNTAILGIMRAAKYFKKKNHLIVSQIEHSAVREAAQRLELEGFEVTYLEVDEYGLIDPEVLRKSIRPETGLISIIYANNEVGTIQDLEALVAIANQAKIPFHTDACQAASYLDLDLKSLKVDALTLNSSKVYGPKGAGLLYLKEGTLFLPQQLGGEQESGMRAGTENLPAIIGFAEAFKLARAEMADEINRVLRLKDQVLEGLSKKLTGITLNGHPTKRIVNNLNLSFDGIEGESALIRLDQKGIMVSTGSACSSQKVEPSEVLLALGKSKNQAHSSLRLTFGKTNTEDQIPQIIDTISEVITDLRSLSL